MNLTRGRSEPCNNNAGGIKNVYLATFVDYDLSQIVGYRNQTVASFPTTQIYKYEGQNKDFSETLSEDGSYVQEFRMRLTSQDLGTAQLLSLLVKNKVRIVIEDRLGLFRVGGIVNGMDAEITANLGGSRVDFNGYDLTLIGNEEFQAPFIADISSVGFTDGTVELGCLLASSDKPASLSNKVADCNVVL